MVYAFSLNRLGKLELSGLHSQHGGWQRANGPSETDTVPLRELATALEFRATPERQSGEKIDHGQSRGQAREYGEALREHRQQAAEMGRLAQAEKVNQDLRGLLGWLKSPLEAGGGRDFPP